MTERLESSVRPPPAPLSQAQVLLIEQSIAAAHTNITGIQFALEAINETGKFVLSSIGSLKPDYSGKMHIIKNKMLYTVITVIACLILGLNLPLLFHLIPLYAIGNLPLFFIIQFCLIVPLQEIICLTILGLPCYAFITQLINLIDLRDLQISENNKDLRLTEELISLLSCETSNESLSSLDDWMLVKALPYVLYDRLGRGEEGREIYTQIIDLLYFLLREKHIIENELANGNEECPKLDKLNAKKQDLKDAIEEINADFSAPIH